MSNAPEHAPRTGEARHFVLKLRGAYLAPRFIKGQDCHVPQWHFREHACRFSSRAAALAHLAWVVERHPDLEYEDGRIVAVRPRFGPRKRAIVRALDCINRGAYGHAAAELKALLSSSAVPVRGEPHLMSKPAEGQGKPR